MGLIIGPVMIFWVISFFLTLRMGYSLLIGKPFLPYVLMVLVFAVIGNNGVSVA